MIHYFNLLLMTIIGSWASFFLKKASNFKQLKDLIFDLDIYIGALLYLISALINIYILNYLPYTVVLPLTSLTYVWTLIIAYFFLKEKINLKRIIAIFMVVIGVIILVI